jgi:LmbE family N-acetylglucosaminyl deacetylase
MNKVAMAIFPHADDAAGMCGGTLIKFANEGWKVILVRVTNDDKDSMSLPTREETERVNTAEFQVAAKILKASEVVDLGFVTDVLGDVSMVALRERIVYMFRKYKPYAVFTFDPYAYYEPNLDHVRVAQAVEEAYWVSNFHLHYPEHLEQGYEPHAVCERWYFARVPLDPNYLVDISDTIEAKIEALCAHDQMIRNTLHQLQLQLKTWGRRIPALDEAIHGDFKPLVAQFVRENARIIAQKYGLEEGEYAEVFRVNRFGAWEEMAQSLSVPLPGEPEEMHTRPCFDPHSGPRLFN